MSPASMGHFCRSSQPDAIGVGSLAGLPISAEVGTIGIHGYEEKAGSRALPCSGYGFEEAFFPPGPDPSVRGGAMFKLALRTCP